ncbi:hypothetical protein ANOBCDAF_04502 [Pleomorphomonas sp. T1.2MG-36]|uniref:thioesterase domain-containing protein n=1 Tax=Pleomorphomonas sp. T1.2MG-36 TaxID=3041167 RepID=UPI002477AB1F|nr:thioesterase domain-containing protein [Pleomorphomonas sp. T1.2MG-36]CAI9403847.1 hypothetical protein ANOBCDAF_04502 [Pleomorphomonas sp. T1.2MG-36]
MERDDLEIYLHQQIPLTKAMGMSVRAVTSDTVTLSAPLAPNINPKGTGFGGSASTLCILAAWSTLHVRLIDAGLPSEIVIHSNAMEYLRPIRGEFVATGAVSAEADWPGFVKTLESRKKARIEIDAGLSCGDEAVGVFRGRFVAFLREGRLTAGNADGVLASRVPL